MSAKIAAGRPSKTAPLTLDFASLRPSLLSAGGSQRRLFARCPGAADVLPEDRRGPVRQGLQDRVAEAAAKYFGDQRKELADIDANWPHCETAANAGDSQQRIAELQQEREKTATLVADLEEG